MTARPTVPWRRLHPAAVAPRYARPGDAGADLTSVEDATIEPGHRVLVRTGIALAVPDGWVGLVHPRSGLAARHVVTVVNAPGTVDAGYRGEILVNLINLDPAEAFTVRTGDRIAQLVLQPVVRARFEPVDALPDSERGAGGFGSTGGFTADTTPGRTS